MSPLTACPDRSALERLLAGSPPEPASDALFAHIESCPACAGTVHQLAHSDTLPDLIRTGVALAATEPTGVEPLVRRILSRPAEPGATVSSPTQAAGEDVAADVLAVLSPPQGEGEIGRLGGYRVLALLGHGGMGAVFQAEDPKLGRLVALKVMLPGVARKPGMKGRFLREARAAAALDHDHLVPVFEVNEANGVPYIAMPFLKGGTLADRLAETDGPRPVPEVLAVGRQIAAGLAAAHARGLVHRDIKPANIWLDATAGGRVKILDFGLARSDADQNLTQSGSVLGTPSYMAPEQARGEPVDGRADLFSLGVVLYRMATGRLPFRGESILAVLSALANDTPPPVRELNPQVPPQLADLIHRLLAKAPAGRPASAEQVIRELDAVNAPPTAPAGEKRKRRPWLPVAVAAAVFGLAGIAFGIYKFRFETTDGTLVVEVDDKDADVRFRQGKLEVWADGRLKYTLSPSEKNKTLPAGKYLLKVVGADGVRLETDQFELTKGGTTTVRVTAEPTRVAQADPPKAASVPADAIPDFPGKVVFRDTFDSAEKCLLPLADGPPKREVTDGKYAVSHLDDKATDNLVADVGPRVKVGAFAVRARAENGFLFVNFRDRTARESNVRWHSLHLTPAGAESVVLNRRNWDKTRWGEVSQSVLQSARPDPELAAGKWVTLAARWSETEYEVWVNGKRVAGGAADPAEVTATTAPVQVCVRPAGDGPVKLELDYVSVWDQFGLPVSAVGPNVASANVDTLRWVLGKRKPGTGAAARVVADGKPVWLEPGAALPTGDFTITAVDLHRMYSEPITDDDLKRIGALTSLRKLNIGAQPVTAAGLKHLTGLTELNELDIWGQSPAAAGELVRGFENKLEMMCLPGDHADEWVELLAGMTKLRYLYCTHGKLSVKGVAGFRNLPALTAITLALMEDRLDGFLPELAKNDRLRSISFDVVGDATKAKIDEFAKRVPACEIRYTHNGKEVVLPAGRR